MSEAYQMEERDPKVGRLCGGARAGVFSSVSLVEQSQLAVDDGRHGPGGAEAVLLLSAKGLTGAPHPGKRGGEVRRHGSQGGRVTLKGRLKVRKPRLRRVGGAGVCVQAGAGGAWIC